MEEISVDIPNCLYSFLKENIPHSTKSEKKRFSLFLKAIHINISRSVLQTGSPDGFAETPAKFWRKVFGNNYNSIIGTLVKLKVFTTLKNNEGNDTYTTKLIKDENNIITGQREPISKKRKLSNKFSYSSFFYSHSNLQNTNQNNSIVFNCVPLLQDTGIVTVTYEHKPKVKTPENLKYEMEFRKMISVTKIDYKGLFELKDTLIKGLKIEDYLIDEKLESEGIKKVKDILTSATYKVTLKKAKKVSRTKGYEVFKDDDKYYTGKRTDFIKMKKTALEYSYTQSINALKNNNLYASRNLTNNRLDTNFTSMKSEFVDKICNDNDYVQKDLQSSQVTLFVNMMRGKLDTVDFNIFYSDVIHGDIYQTIAIKLGITRDEAKIVVLTIIFDKVKSKCKYKELITEMYPTTMAYIDSYKRTNGYKKFSVLLQKVESEIFIDNLYERLKKQTSVVFTKHDSVIVRRSFLKKADQIIENYFREIDFEATIN